MEVNHRDASALQCFSEGSKSKNQNYPSAGHPLGLHTGCPTKLATPKLELVTPTLELVTPSEKCLSVWNWLPLLNKLAKLEDALGNTCVVPLMH